MDATGVQLRTIAFEYGPVGPYRGGMRRILVYGVTGDGKSALARRIGERLGLPYHSIDDLAWEPGWEPVPTSGSAIGSVPSAAARSGCSTPRTGNGPTSRCSAST